MTFNVLIRSSIYYLASSLTGCLRPTPTDHLPVLSGIQPAELRRMGATLFLGHRESLDPDYVLYGLLSGSSDTRQVRPRSRRPFVSAARNRLDNLARYGTEDVFCHCYIDLRDVKQLMHICQI